MKTLILGSTGQLGTALRRLLPDAVGLGRAEADLFRPETLRALVRNAGPAVVFNCAAYNAVDRAESDLAGAFTVNAFAVRELALGCADVGAALVHFSTNYVFGQDEARRMPYHETDLPGPVSAYGVSKLAGEHFALMVCAKALVIRTCGLFGYAQRAGASNFVERLLERARRGEPLHVVNDQVCTPTSASDLAEAALRLVEAGAQGLHHFTNAGACTWYEFACEAIRLAERNNPVEPVTSDTFAAPARRPGYSVLACDAYDRHSVRPRRSWQLALEKYLKRQATGT
jgi:dTDP-4-dehydrorhamnose reductase